MTVQRTQPAFDFPTGTITPCAGIVPAGWALCDGTTYDGTSDAYSPLWDLIGTTYGGTAQSSFKVPNLGGRVPVGVKATTSGSGLDGPVGAWGGATDVTVTSSQTGIPTHGHSSTWDGSTGDPGHSHTVGYSSHNHQIPYNATTVYLKGSNVNVAVLDGGYPSQYAMVAANTAVSMGAQTITGATVAANTAVSSGTTHTNVQPQLALQYIIKL